MSANMFKVGDIVKIKDDAYSGAVGRIHNGRICEVVEVRHGDVIVRSIDDKDPMLTQTRNSPYILEKVGDDESINRI